MRRAFRPTLTTLALATLMAGCASSNSTSSYYATALTSISDARVNLHNNRLEAYIGCNRLSASAQESGMQLQIGEINATRMACQPGTDQREQVLIEFLERSPKLDKSGDMWILRDNVHAVVVSNDPAPGMPVAASDMKGSDVTHRTADARSHPGTPSGDRTQPDFEPELAEGLDMPAPGQAAAAEPSPTPSVAAQSQPMHDAEPAPAVSEAPRPEPAVSAAEATRALAHQATESYRTEQSGGGRFMSEIATGPAASAEPVSTPPRFLSQVETGTPVSEKAAPVERAAPAAPQAEVAQRAEVTPQADVAGTANVAPADTVSEVSVSEPAVAQTTLSEPAPGATSAAEKGDSLVRNWLPGLALIDNRRQQSELSTPQRYTRAYAVRKRGHWVWYPARPIHDTREVLTEKGGQSPNETPELTENAMPYRDSDIETAPLRDLGALGLDGDAAQSLGAVEIIRISNWRA